VKTAPWGRSKGEPCPPFGSQDPPDHILRRGSQVVEGALACDTAARLEAAIDGPMPSSDSELERLRQQASMRPLRARIIRAVASSTAIETGQPVAEIERALMDRQSTQATPA